MQLNLVGGKDVGQLVRRILKNLFTNDVANLYSFKGVKEKKIFEGSVLYTLVCSKLQVMC